MCVDKLWDKYYSLTPYHYSGNNPVSLLDPNGLYVTNDLSDNSQMSNLINNMCNNSSIFKEMFDKIQKSSIPFTYNFGELDENIHGITNTDLKNEEFEDNGLLQRKIYKSAELESTEIIIDNTNKPGTNYVRTIAHETEHALQLLDNLLDYLNTGEADKNKKENEKVLEFGGTGENGKKYNKGAMDVGNDVKNEVKKSEK